MSLDTVLNVRKVQVTLAVAGDGAVPENLSDALGQVSLGPIGLLGLLETQLGIPSAGASFTTRLVQYLACIDQVDHPEAFYHASYSADPFSVAKVLLQWRDQWYLAGWRGTFENTVPEKLADMEAIEQRARMAVEPGLGQRIQRVIDLLPGNPVAVSSIALRDRLADFPRLWQTLITAVKADISESGDPQPQAQPGTDLHTLQSHLLITGNKKIGLRGDGTVIILRADSPQESTPITCLLTRKWIDEAPDKSIAVLAESRGELLDDTMESLGDARLGFSSLSPWRPAFQVLPLACELLWEPLNPVALFQFLSHSIGPIPGRIRGKLAQTVAGTPGIGGERWKKTLQDALEQEDETSRKRLQDSIQYWLESPRFQPIEGVDCKTLSQRARKVADWLQGACEASDNAALKSLYNIALNQAGEFVQAVQRLESSGRDTLSRDNVLRLIEEVRGSGAPVSDRNAEIPLGMPAVLRAGHSGAFTRAVDNVIWWDCQASDRVRRWPWSRAERAALGDNGVLLHSEEDQLEWLGRAWLRPVLCAAERFTLILHQDVERHHPVWDQITSLTEGLPIIQLSAREPSANLGIESTPLEARALPPRIRWWQLPAALNIAKRDVESFSSLDSFIHSPYQWLLRYGAKIRPGSLTSVSDGNQLKGNLAHRIYEEFFNAHVNIGSVNPRAINDWVDDHVMPLLQQEGALLLAPGRQAECERFITQVQDSLTTLLEHLQLAGVVNVEMELQQDGIFSGGKLTGSIDLLATRADGKEAIVDIKWGGTKYRRDALASNSYLQLATYAQLRRCNNATALPQLSYFIVVDSLMLSLDHSYFPNAEIIPNGVDENTLGYWQRFENSWRWRRAQFDNGLVEVTVGDTEPTAESTPGEDALAVPASSDMFNDYAALTGWGANS
jgi:ATP-dependent helicase/nuclease subunit B